MISASEQSLDDSDNFSQFPLRKVSYFVFTPGAVKKKYNLYKSVRPPLDI